MGRMDRARGHHRCLRAVRGQQPAHRGSCCVEYRCAGRRPRLRHARAPVGPAQHAAASQRSPQPRTARRIIAASSTGNERCNSRRIPTIMHASELLLRKLRHPNPVKRLVLSVLLPVLLPLAHAAPLPEAQIGIGLTKPPYIMGPGKTGIEYDIADKALEAGGYHMVAQHLPPARALALLRAGKLDGMLTVDEGIGGTSYFSDTYMYYQNVATTLTSRNIRLRNINDLEAYSVAAFQNASLILGPEFNALAARHLDYKEHPQQITQNRLLYAGRVDVVIGDKLIFRYLSRQVESGIDSNTPVSFQAIFPPSARKAVFRDAALRDAFNRGLKIIRQNGEYAAIMKKYQDYTAP
ncbi:transporter substrate-binding domain-containing protein [Herbaspirillum sp. HC18]|nr:transporter substrate-binding domain-containing protein [Herbaspirillum sp. HC18]